MNIDHIKLPPISQKFYDRIVRVFPALLSSDIKKDTDMIDVHRNAAQQEVIEYIKKAVQKDTTNDINITIWDRFKYVFKI